MRVIIFVPKQGSEYAYRRSLGKSWNSGLRKHGIIPKVVKLIDYDESVPIPEADVFIIRGWKKGDNPKCIDRTRLIEYQEKCGRQCLIIDKGYIKGRNAYRSVGWDGLNGRANFCNENSSPDRWRSWDMGLKPWQEIKEDNVILLVGQKPKDAAVLYAKEGINQWYIDSIKDIKMFTNRKIVFRSNPKVKVLPDLGIEISKKSLEEDLNRAHVVVTFNSNVGTDAIIAGVPVVACDEGAMVGEITSRQIDQSSMSTPLKLDRKQWAYNLAHAQWTKEEVAEGLCWDQLKEGCKSYVCSGA